MTSGAVNLQCSREAIGGSSVAFRTTALPIAGTMARTASGDLVRGAFDRGAIVVGHWRHAPIRVHWSFLVGALVVSGFRLAPGCWLAYFGLVLVHELGHAILVVRHHLRVEEILLHGLGGECHWSGEPTRREAAIVAWGGVLAQLLVLIAALPLFIVDAPPPFVAEVLFTLTVTNAILIAVNLIPIEPLDGAEAWMLATPHVDRWRRRVETWERRHRERKHLRRLDRTRPTASQVEELDRAIDAALSGAERETDPDGRE